MFQYAEKKNSFNLATTLKDFIKLTEELKSVHNFIKPWVVNFSTLEIRGTFHSHGRAKISVTTSLPFIATAINDLKQGTIFSARLAGLMNLSQQVTIFYLFGVQ